jgi:signal transduction histidine kinase
MDVGSHRKSIAVFITLGVILVVLAVALSVGWIVFTWRTGLMLFLGILVFPFIITVSVLNTIFLVREIRRNEQHDSFINAVTHELKTPVASIRLYLETLRTREVDEVRRQDFYRIMLEDSDRLLSTIEQVLRAGRSRQSRRHLQLTPVDLRDMVRESVELARTRYHLSAECLEFVDRLDGAGGQVMGDLEELQAAISNLIDNAIKYSGERVHVSVEVTQPEPKRVAVRVTDQGVGIPRGELSRIFTRFYRIPGSKRTRATGTGLGLSIVASVARKHGGKVFAESEGLERGSTFTLLLPTGSQ